MSILQQFTAFIKGEHLFQRQDVLLVAVSGGVDSVVLCELCRQSGYIFMIAHCNFQLRGEESTRDEQFVRELAERYQVPIAVKVFDTMQYAAENKLSIQVAARQLRYTWFKEIMEGSAASNPGIFHTFGSTAPVTLPVYLLTAHHADDNIETMLMNFFKGTGISGLRGMLPKQGKIIRPLLFAQKTQLLEFSRINNLYFVEDSSNELIKYTRNFFRNRLLPEIQKVFPGVEGNLSRNLERFREIEMLYLQSIQLYKKKLLEIKGSEVHIPALQLKKSSPLETIVFEISRDYGFTPPQAKEIIQLLDAVSGKYVQSITHRIIKNRKWLIISPIDTAKAETIIINQGDKKMVFENGVLEFKQIPVLHCQLTASPEIAQLDAGEIIFPLILRKKRQADYFYPLGMQKKKKLNRFLSDQKLSLIEKEQTWLLETNKKIIWIAGKRIDDRFKVTERTSTVLQITFTPGDLK